MLSDSLFMHLSDDDAISAIAADRIYPLLRPERDPTPALIYTQTAGVDDVTLCGQSGLSNKLFQLDSYAKSYSLAHQLADAVKARLAGFQGIMGDTAGTDIASIALESESDLDDPEPGLFRVLQIFNIWHR
jgi:hypothetical protein